MWNPARRRPLGMGVPKRKAQDGPASPASTAKRARTEELTGVRFKAQLKDPQAVGPGECGLAATGEHALAKRPPGRGVRGVGPVAASQTQLLLSAAVRIYAGQGLPSRLADGKPRPRRSGVRGPRASPGWRAALPCLVQSATLEGRPVCL